MSTMHRLVNCDRSATLQMITKILRGLGGELSDVFPQSLNSRKHR